MAIHQHYQSLDQSSPTSDSSGYDSNTSIISSIHSSYGDDGEHQHHRIKQYDYNENHKQQLRTTKLNPNRLSINNHQQTTTTAKQSRRRRLADEPESVISHLDHNLLDDQERILKRMLSIEHRYVPMNIIDTVYRSSTTSDINEQTRFELTEWMHERNPILLFCYIQCCNRDFLLCEKKEKKINHS
ncbi:hypothetical protein BLA29_008113 [Euroglyphus maynei]|uniref:Uncharacterized protein n=1 Tax=Euroglyphus maynei TaxID=6958 RepID=A0A1Y3B4A1_EURMA|nr:hypothetical protein BLA29_008113 [Euroglyphus maynei]